MGVRANQRGLIAIKMGLRASQRSMSLAIDSNIQLEGCEDKLEESKC